MEYQELKTTLKEFSEEIKTAFENRIQLIDYKLTTMNDNFVKLEKKNEEIEDAVRDLQMERNNHLNNCPLKNTIDELEGRISNAEKELARQGNIKKFVNRVLIILGTLVGLTASLLKIFGKI